MNAAVLSATGIVACAGVSALAALVRPEARGAVRLQGVLLVAASGLLALWAAAAVAGSGGGFSLSLPQPFGGLTFGLSGLSAGWCGLAAILFAATGLARAGGYRPGGSGTLALQHALLVSVAGFLASRSLLGLLFGWEALSLVAYLLVIRDGRRVQRAAWAMLALAELGSMTLFFVLAVLSAGAGPGAPAGGWALALALLALAAFGTKAGLFPFLVWVPLAEPEADGDTAGLLSGLLTAVAVAGFLDVVRVVPAPAAPLGAVTAALGLCGAVYGVLMGLVDRDAKRVLAYGTLESLGLVFTGLGLAWVLGGAGAGGAAVLAASGAWVLLVAHGGAKYALFLLTGHVEQAGGLRLLDRMGGLLRRARRAGAVAVAAACTLAGLPPFGVFLGEWLLVEACLVPTPHAPALHVALAFVAALLALVGAGGLTLYLRWLGVAWLGTARSARANACPDASRGTVWGAWLGAGLAALSGIGAGWTLPWFQAAATWLASGAPVIAPTYVSPRPYAGIVALGAALFRGVAGGTGNVLFPDGGFSVGSPWDLAVFVCLLATVVALLRSRGRRVRVRRVRAWIGGEPVAGAGLTFTGEGFSHVLRLAFSGFFGLSRSRRQIVPQPGAGTPGMAAQPTRMRYRAEVVLRLEHHVYLPLLKAAARASGAVRQTQSGRIGHYVLFLLGALVAGLVVLAR